MTRYANGPTESPGFLLWRTTILWQREVTAVLAPFDLTHVQFVLLACAWWMNGEGKPPNQAQLAAQAATDVKMTSEVLRRLEQKGFLIREPDPNDSRARVIKPTRAGISAARKSIAAVEAVDLDFFGPVHTKGLVSSLAKLAGIV